MNGIRNTYLYVCGSQRLLNIRRIYTSAGLIGLMSIKNMFLYSAIFICCITMLGMAETKMCH